jgi:hypothetical protein
MPSGSRVAAVVLLLVAALFTFAPMFAKASEAPVRVMIVGTFHMSNPGKDLHNQTVDDMLSPERQAQIKATVDGLAKFKPTVVDAEWDAPVARERYAAYENGTLAPSRNEVVQLAFRLAKQSGLTTVNGVDADGDFPFEPVQAWAQAHGQGELLAAQGAAIDAFLKAQSDVLNSKGVSAALRVLNDPARLAGDNAFYRTTLKIGAGSTQPGADLLTQWYRRNFLICANILQLTKPGDRVVVFYGSGHSFLLRQCIAETPGFELVEANDYLPK